jgi:hypothetical protein
MAAELGRSAAEAKRVMIGVVVEIRRYVDDSQPGWVECGITDADGQEWAFVEKVPIVTAEDLDTHSHYPRPGVIACQVVDRRWELGREAVVIDTELPWHVEATTGQTRFVVRPEQLLEFELGSSAPKAPDAEPGAAPDPAS